MALNGFEQVLQRPNLVLWRMMNSTKTEKALSAFVIIQIIFFHFAYAQIPDDLYSPLCRIHQRIGMTDFEISYSRPCLKGRALFGELLTMGKEWRTGADAATTIRFDDGVKIKGQKLKPGIYALYTEPGADKWKVIFNKDIYSDPYEGRDKKTDFLQLEIAVRQVSLPVETFTISISDISKDLLTANIDLTWGNMLLKIPIEVPGKWLEQ